MLRLQEEEQEAVTLGLIRRLEAVSRVRAMLRICHDLTPSAPRQLNSERASIQAALQSATPHDGIAARLLRSPRSASHLNIAQSSSPPSTADLGLALHHTSLQQQAHGSGAPPPPLLEGTTSMARGPRTPRTPEAMLHMQRSATFGPSGVYSPPSPYFPSVPHPTPAFPRAAVGDQARQIAQNADSLAAQVEELVNTSRSFAHVWEYADAMRDECIRLRGLVGDVPSAEGYAADASLQLGLPTSIAPLPVPHPRTTVRTRTDSVASAASSTRARGRTITSPVRLDPPPIGPNSPGLPAMRKLRVTEGGELGPVRREQSPDIAQQADAEEMDDE